MFSEFAAAHEATSQRDGEQDAMRACTASRTVRWELGREARQPIAKNADRESRVACMRAGKAVNREIGKSRNRETEKMAPVRSFITDTRVSVTPPLCARRRQCVQARPTRSVPPQRRAREPRAATE